MPRVKKTSKVRQPKLGGCIAYGFFGIFAAAGLAAFYYLTWQPIAGIVEARGWDQTTCVITSSEVAVSHGSDSTTYRVDIRYTYEAEWGETFQGDRYDFSTGSSSGYDGKARVVKAHPPGSEVDCWVSPEDPSQAVIDRSPGGYLWWGLFPLPFLAVGLGGLLFLMSPAGRRTVGRASGRESRSATQEPRPVTGRPATRRGPLELESEASPRAKLVGLLFFALFWNGIVSVFLFAVIVPSFRQGDPEWFVTIFMIPFVLVGLGLIGGVVYQFLASFNPRPRLTLAEGYLTLGSETSVRWQFSGRAGRIQKLTIALEGQEWARYRRGTSTYTDKHVFFTRELVSEEGRFGAVHRGNASLAVPERTMPTFEADNNKIQWRLKVHGDVPFWPDVNESFAITVHPGGDDRR